MTEENKLKAKMKKEELKQKRSGKTQNLPITVSENLQVNFQCAFDEVKKVCEMHKLGMEEVNMIGSQLNWISIQISINQRMAQLNESLQKSFSPQPKTFVEKQEEKFKQEQIDGTIRIKPDNK